MADSLSAQPITACPSCHQDITTEGIEVGAIIACPYCEHNFPVTKMFGKFMLEQKIGSGGMGAVYIGRDTDLNRVVAIKVLKAELTEDEKFLSTFKHEAQITAKLNHPNIVQVYAASECEGSYYIVMEHIDGGTLDDRIVNFNNITELEALEVGIGVAAGLKCALQGGLIHRDIKPGNILFGANNTPKVVDFGLSLDTSSVDQFAGEIWGTPYYLPPEKLEGLAEDFRSDMYSLGASLFHAITGRPPYDDEDPRKVAMMHLKGVAVSVKTFVPGISDQTARAISRMMARYPNDRFSTYDEVIIQLEDARRRLLAVEKPDDDDSAPIEVVSVPENSKQTLVIFGVIIAVIIAAVVILVFFRDALFNDKKNVPIELRDYDPAQDTGKPKPTAPPVKN